MGAEAFYFVVERVEDCDVVGTMVVDCIGEHLEADSMACSIISTSMSPGCGDEEVGVYCLVEESIDSV